MLRRSSLLALTAAAALVPSVLAGCGGGSTTAAPVTGNGDPAAGAKVFADAGCKSCHTLKAAGASGAAGPNLDESKPDFDLVVNRVEMGGGSMPSFEGELSAQEIADIAAYVVQSTSG